MRWIVGVPGVVIVIGFGIWKALVGHVNRGLDALDDGRGEPQC